MDEGIGPLALIILVAVGCILAVLLLIGFLAFVLLGGIGVLALRGRAERAKQEREVGPEEAW